MSTDENDKEIEEELTPTAVDLNNGTFDVAFDKVVDGDSYTAVYCDYFGYHRAISDALMGFWLTGIEIICDLLLIASDYVQKYWNYNLEAVINETAKQKRQGRKISLLIDSDDKKVMSVAADICRDTDTLFQELPDGRFSPRVDAEITDPVLELMPDECFDYIQTKRDITTVVTSLTCSYGPAGGVEKKTYTDITRSKELSNLYKRTNSQKVESILANLDSAKHKVKEALDKAETPRVSAQFRTRLTWKNKQLSTLQTITAPRDRAGNRAVFDVLSVDIKNDEAELIINANKRADIEFSYEYEQGILHNSVYSDARYFGITNSIEV